MGGKQDREAGPLTSQLRSAMTAIDKIINSHDADILTKRKALLRIVRYADMSQLVLAEAEQMQAEEVTA